MPIRTIIYISKDESRSGHVQRACEGQWLITCYAFPRTLDAFDVETPYIKVHRCRLNIAQRMARTWVDEGKLPGRMRRKWPVKIDVTRHHEVE